MKWHDSAVNDFKRKATKVCGSPRKRKSVQISVVCKTHFTQISCDFESRKIHKEPKKKKAWQENHETSEGARMTGRNVSSLSGCCLHAHSCNQQPEHDHQSHKQEESSQKLLVHVLRCPRSRWRRSSIIDVKSCSKDTEWKGTDSE